MQCVAPERGVSLSTGAQRPSEPPYSSVVPSSSGAFPGARVELNSEARVQRSVRECSETGDIVLLFCVIAL